MTKMRVEPHLSMRCLLADAMTRLWGRVPCPSQATVSRDSLAHLRCLSLRPYCTWQIESRRPIGRAAVRPHWPAPPRDALGAPAARRPPRPARKHLLNLG